MPEQRILALSGAGGALGRAILRAAKGRECRIYALSESAEQLRKEFSGAEEDFCFLERSSFSEIPWQECDILIHCAFPRDGDGARLADGMRYARELMTRAKSGGVKAAVNISSQSVYSQKRKGAAGEDEAICPESPYAVAKYGVELLTNAIFEGTPHSSLRLASLIGPEMEQRVINKFIRSAMAGEDICIVSGGARFGYLDVRDAAEGILTMALSAPDQWRDVYNLGPKCAYTLEEMAQAARDIAKELTGAAVSVKRMDGCAEQNSALNAQRFYQAFGWEPRITLRESAKYICDERRERRG